MEVYNSDMKQESFHSAGEHLAEAFQEAISAAKTQGISGRRESRLSRPPTPPYVRFRIRRFRLNAPNVWPLGQG